MTVEPAAAFATDDLALAEPPTSTVEIGGRTFPTRACKVKFWEDVALLAMASEDATRAAERLEQAGATLPPEARRDLESKVAAGPTLFQVRDAFTGFLFRCLGKEDRAALQALWDDEDSPIDSPHLYQAALDVFYEFKDYYSQRSANMGFTVPDLEAPANRAARRTTTTKKPAARRATATRRS